MSATTLIPARRRRWRPVAAVAIALALSTSAVQAVETVHVTAVTPLVCVAGILSTGVGFIALAAAPPVGVIAWLAWGSASVTGVLSVQACQTTWLKSAIGNYYRQHGFSGAVWYGYARDWWGRLYGSYGGVGSGGGGGGSGSW